MNREDFEVLFELHVHWIVNMRALGLLANVEKEKRKVWEKSESVCVCDGKVMIFLVDSVWMRIKIPRLTFK